MKPSIGRIVHFISPEGAHWPAMITRVWSDTCVNLQVLADAKPAFVYTSSLQDEDLSKVNSWHWPERE